MHAPQPLYIPSTGARPSRHSTRRSTVAAPWVTERGLLGILEGIVFAVLLATFLLA